MLHCDHKVSYSVCTTCDASPTKKIEPAMTIRSSDEAPLRASFNASGRFGETDIAECALSEAGIFQFSWPLDGIKFIALKLLSVFEIAWFAHQLLALLFSFNHLTTNHQGKPLRVLSIVCWLPGSLLSVISGPVRLVGAKMKSMLQVLVLPIGKQPTCNR